MDHDYCRNDQNQRICMMRPTNSRTACSYLDQFPDSIDQCDYVFHCLGARRDRDAADAHSLAAGRQHSLLPDGTPSAPMRDPVPPDTRPGGLTSTVRGRPRQMPPRTGGRGTERFGSQVQRGHGGSHPRCVLSTSFERKSHRFLSSIRSGPAQPF